jgi:retron-type reverse transcriptase
MERQAALSGRQTCVPGPVWAEEEYARTRLVDLAIDDQVRAIFFMKTHKNLFHRVTAFGNLYQAFREASRGKRNQPDVQRFEYHLEERLWEIKRELEAGGYCWGGYRSFWINDPKPRLIHAAPFRDRVVHHAIHQILEPIFEPSFIYDTYACRKGKGTLSAVLRYDEFVRRLKGKGYVLKCDIKRYFPSIVHVILKSLIRRKIGDTKLLRLLNSLIDTYHDSDDKGIPIGNLTSQLFANIYLTPLDYFIKEQLKQRCYIRYMDDFVILGKQKNELWDILKGIKGFLDTYLKLGLNFKRVAVMPIEKGIDFLGHVIFLDGYKRIRRRNVVNFRKRLKWLSISYSEGTVLYDHARSSIASWLGLVKYANAFYLSRAIFSEHDVDNVGKRLMIKRK